MKKSILASNIIGAVLLGIFISISGCKKDDNEKPDPIIFNPSINYGNMTDQDGNTYKTVTICSQTWMAENLKVTHYRNGDSILHFNANGTPYFTNTGLYFDYDNSPGYSKIYGNLYNWFAVNDSRNLAPAGWHVPTDEEWTTLIDCLGGDNIAGGKLKETGITHWDSPNAGATNESGFTALPGGMLYLAGIFDNMGGMGVWWSSTAEIGTGNAWYRILSYGDIIVDRDALVVLQGHSVRCVKDE